LVSLGISNQRLLPTKVVSCDPATGQLITGPVTRAEAGPLACSEGRKCSALGADCRIDGDCPAGETCEDRCIWLEPFPVPNETIPANSACIVQAFGADVSGVATCDGDSSVRMPLRTRIFVSGDVLDGAGVPDIPGVQACPLCTRQCIGGSRERFPCVNDGDCVDGSCDAAALCLGGASDLDPCTPGRNVLDLGSLGGAFTSHDCGPSLFDELTSSIGGSPADIELSTRPQIVTAVDLPLQPRVFCGFCRDVFGYGSSCFEGDPDPFCPPAEPSAPGLAVRCDSDADCADGDEYESCMQRSSGAFGEEAASVFMMTGAPAECLADGQPKPATLASGYCSPPTFDASVDALGDFPGPSAWSLNVEMQLAP
jgi:hypothetical protein